MNVFLYVMLFIMGTFFGSFFTLAVYRIPLGKDITHERSFCPNCNHKLGVLDLIPVWSYLFLKGKCRYCGEKVRIRYLLLEVISGLFFVLAYASFHIQDIVLQVVRIPQFIAFIFVYITLVLVGGIDKEYRKINSSILLFGAVCQVIYILYLYMIEKASVYRYIIYFAIFMILWKTVRYLEKKKLYGWLEVILLICYINFALGIKVTLLSLGVAVLLLLFSKTKLQKQPLGLIIGISTISCQIVENFIEFWIK